MTESNTSPVVPVRASTLILVRGEGKKFQVYLLKRSSQSGFMPGNYVFPGGTVDSEDRNVDLWSGYVDLDRDQVITRFGEGLNNADVVSHGIAAIRETFEEAGVLLARQNGGTGRDLDNLRDRRLVGSLRKTWLRELVASGEWTLRFSELACWSHWITPKARSKRYDTRFFAAFMPEGQECRPDNRETTHGIWVSPETALRGNLKGEIPLSPPAVTTLHELLQYQSVGDLKKEMRTRVWGEARVPRLVRMPEATFLLLPWDPHYHDQEIKADVEGLENRLALLGSPFSRLWYRKGVWRPFNP
ncbi:MAG: NUDIX hydrolase [Desulfobacteraceae bacterium]|nr:NUDIX hydrolase [Desulfobacteraceae bacterium]